jgi:hypothetical protein
MCHAKGDERVKYMILLYGSQQDYDAMSGKAIDKPGWRAQDFQAFNKGLADSGELVETRGLTAPYMRGESGSRMVSLLLRMACTPRR